MFVGSRMNSSRAAFVGKGYCTATTDGWAGDCEKGLLGTWRMGPDLPNVAACIKRCQACVRCRFVSVSTINRDCSWYAGCTTGSLGHVYGGGNYRTYRVKPNTPPPEPQRQCTQEQLASPRAAQHNRTFSGEAGVHFVTFYSEGPPRDPGIPLGAMARLLEAAFAPHVDSFRGYTPHEVRRQQVYGVRGDAVVRASNVTASMNTGLSAIGQLAAKPFVILHRLLELPRGDLLVYKDANVLKRPNLLAGAADLRDVAEWALERAGPAADVFIPFENAHLKLKHHCKTHAIRTMVPPSRWQEVFEKPLHHSCQLVAKHTPAAVEFLWRWLQACLNHDMLAQEPDPRATRHPDFRWHTHEQCLFSLVAALTHNDYRRQLWFCWTLERASARELPLLSGEAVPPDLTAPCSAPRTTMLRTWLPVNTTRWGHCIDVECPGLRRDCAWSEKMLPWFRQPPGSPCCRLGQD